jgi:hypothetical protein
MHPAVIVPSKPSAEWLINKVTRLQSLPIHSELVRKVKEARDYRNALAHSHLSYPDMPLTEALSRLNRFLDKL